MVMVSQYQYQGTFSPSPGINFIPEATTHINYTLLVCFITPILRTNTVKIDTSQPSSLRFFSCSVPPLSALLCWHRCSPIPNRRFSILNCHVSIYNWRFSIPTGTTWSWLLLRSIILQFLPPVSSPPPGCALLIPHLHSLQWFSTGMGAP